MTKKHLFIGVIVTVVGGQLFVRTVFPSIAQSRRQTTDDQAMQFKIWMDEFQKQMCGAPQAVTGPVAIERDPEKLHQMKMEAIRRIEAHRHNLATDSH